MMPIVVTILAIRADLRDVREGHPLFLWSLPHRAGPSGDGSFAPASRTSAKSSSSLACSTPLTRFMVFGAFYVVQMLIVAVACAIVPYFLVRGPVTRIVNSTLRRWRGGTGPMVDPTKPDIGGHDKYE